MPTPATNATPSLLLSYLRLCRLPNVFTAVADVVMGFLFVASPFVHSSTSPLGVLIGLTVATVCLYSAGMVLNDLYDVEVDRAERPARPLPSGQITIETARKLGYGLLGLGLMAGWLSGLLDPRAESLHWRSGVIASLLVLTILAYDTVLKKTIVGPLVMGSCRFFNILMGMSLATVFRGSIPWLLDYDPAQLLVAGGIGVYIAGVTWFARSEATVSPRPLLIGGLIVMVAGLVLLSLFPNFGQHAARLEKIRNGLWPLMVMLLAVTPLRRSFTAIMQPEPESVQTAVVHSIRSLIMFDAAICLVTHGPAEAVAVLALLAPMLLLGRWVYST